MKHYVLLVDEFYSAGRLHQIGTVTARDEESALAQAKDVQHERFPDKTVFVAEVLCST
ncbi:MAG: hypothetical protein AAB897_02860 [Patescibacteria group bacterium]